MKQITLLSLYCLSFLIPWMATISPNASMPPDSGDCSIACNVTDSLALVDFYNQTNNGPCLPGSPNVGWTTPWDLNDCVNTWPGVCVNSQGRVVELLLNNSGLTGPIPEELSLLTELTLLQMSNNCLTGEIPESLGDLTNMIRFWIDGNELVGTVPDELCNMTNLLIFFLDENNLTGTFPDCFNDLDGLGTLDLFDNCFDSLPDLTGMASIADGKMRVFGNKLTFDDLLPNIDDIGPHYSPQDSVCIELDTTVMTGTVFNLSLGIDYGITTNSYQWYKDGVLFGAPTNSNTLVFDPVTFDIAGEYHCQVTNPAFPLLTLYSRGKTVNVICGTSTFEFVEDVCDGFEIEIGGVTYDEGNPCDNITLPGADQYGCDSIINICLTYSPPPASTLDTILCPGESITINGTEYDEDNDSGLESFGVPDQFNCDSSIQVNVSFYPPAVFDFDTTICKYDFLFVDGEEFDCDDPDGQVIIEGASFHGCDSIINVSLTFFPLATDTIDGTYCTGQEIIINGTTYDADDPDGEEIITNGSWRGCDSIITIDLTFGDGVEFLLDASICEGQEIEVNGTIYDCDNPDGTEVIVGGSFLNCDSTIIVELTCFESEHGTLNVFVCEGEEYEFNGETYDEDDDEGEENLGDIGFNGCDSIVDFTLSFYSPAFSTIDTTICDNESIIVDGEMVSSGGAYVIEEGSFRGCDSTIFVTITKLPLATHTINDVLCPGGSVTVNNVIYDVDNDSGEETIFGGAFNGCDSIITIELTFGDAVVSQTDEALCPGETLTVEGGIILNENNTMYTDTLFGGSQSGCDSITNINITYHPVSISTINPSICAGSFIEVGGEIVDQTNPIDTIIMFNGSYTGCDSTIIVNANIITVPTGEYTTTLCPGESIVINGTTYDEITDSGLETISMGSFNDCDTSFTVTIQFYPESSSTINNTLCDGESLEIGGITLDENNPSDTIVLPDASFYGCDSLVFVNLEFYPEATSTIDYTLCFGQSIEVNGTTYDQGFPSGTEVFTEGSFHGCDSTVIIDLEFNSAVEVTLDPILCDPSSVVIVNNNTYDILTQVGTETMMSVSGCDSIVTIDLTFPDSAFVFYNNVLCPGDELIVNGVAYNEDMPMGTEVEEGASLFGCDVYHVVDISFHDVSESTTNETLCFGGEIVIGGVVFNAANTSDTIVLPDAAYTGCDSFAIVSIDFFPEIIVNIDSTLCEGQVVIVNNNTYDFGTPTGTEIMTSFSGCDSTVNINLTFGGAVLSSYNDVLCEGEEIVINGMPYNMSNPMGSDTFPDASFTGCDSILNIAISFIPPTFGSIDTTLCIGDELVINNITYDESNLSGIDTLFGANQMGCDSILDITVSYFPVAENTIDTTLCSGDEFIWNGITYPPVDTIINDVMVGGSFNGCDSMLTINVSHYDEAVSNLDTMLCIGEELELHGTMFNADNMSGDIVLSNTSMNGCDSIISVTITYYLLATSSETLSICEGDTIFWNGQTLTTTGTYEETFSGLSSEGCDSMAMLDLTVVNLADLGFANAGTDMITCDETLQLGGNLPSNITGTWTVMEGSAELENPNEAQTNISDFGGETLALSWTLSSSLCPNYDSDTIHIMTGIIPDATDDEYTAEPGIVEVPISILDNDIYQDINDWYFNILEAPEGDLEDQGDGLFNFIAPSELLGGLVSFQYELCNEDCPEVCDTATVRIQLQEEIFLDFPNTITANGDGVNDFFVIPDIENQPNQFEQQELIVFNRWGDVVYSAKPYLNDWGGTNKDGKILPQATYYYILRLNVAEGYIYRGDITILK